MIHNRSTFENSYAGQPPWDIGRPQKPFIDAADCISGSVLDAGCGTGDTALFFAGRGCEVTGFDFIEEAINRARRKAAEQGVKATFMVKDAMTLKDWQEEPFALPNKGGVRSLVLAAIVELADVLVCLGGLDLGELDGLLGLVDGHERFDNVIDSGLFHVFSDEDRRRYVEGLATVLKPGGRLFLMCFSNEEPGERGPRRVSIKELHDSFAEGWVIESIEPTRAEARPELKDAFSEGGPKVWFVVVRRA